MCLNLSKWPIPTKILFNLVVAAAAAVVINNNFPLCYSDCLSTRPTHLQIRKEDHDPSIFTCQAHTIDIHH